MFLVFKGCPSLLRGQTLSVRGLGGLVWFPTHAESSQRRSFEAFMLFHWNPCSFCLQKAARLGNGFLATRVIRSIYLARVLLCRLQRPALVNISAAFVDFRVEHRYCLKAYSHLLHKNWKRAPPFE